MNPAAQHIQHMYIYNGRVATSDPERVPARTDSLSMPRSLGWRSFSNRLPAHSLHECHVFRYVHGMIMGKQYLRHACPAPGSWFGFWFLVFCFCLQYCRPVVGTLLPAKTWATCHSTLCFHRDSKVSIDSNDSLRNNTIINKIGNNKRTYQAMQPKAAANIEVVILPA